jgi:hypothetical protein
MNIPGLAGKFIKKDAQNPLRQVRQHGYEIFQTKVYYFFINSMKINRCQPPVKSDHWSPCCQESNRIAIVYDRLKKISAMIRKLNEVMHIPAEVLIRAY